MNEACRMKSIDKLRQFLEDQFGSDRFAIHGYGYTQGMAIAKLIEAEIAANYLELPRDADGVPIHVGDVMMDGKTPRYAVAVAPESFMMDGYETGSFYRPGLAKNHRHVKPRTLEDVLREYGKAYHAHMADNYMNYDGTDEQVVEKYADEIRGLLGGDA